MLRNGQPLCSLFRKSSAAVTCISTIGINDDLTTGQTCISVWSADYETSGRIDKEFGISIDQLLWKDRIKDIFLNILMDLFLGNVLIMLVDKTTASSLFGFPASSYSTETCVFPSGRR